MREQLKRVDTKILLIRGGLLVAGILFVLFLYHYNRLEKVALYENEGRSFARATVTEIIKDNQKSGETYIGNQTVELKITSGKNKGKTVEAKSASGYLFGTHCVVGKKVIALISESGGERIASVYGVDREMAIFAIIGIFVITLILIGGKQGMYAVFGLGFTVLCILFLFLPMIYKGNSPIFAAVVVVALTTMATMYLIGGATRKSMAAVIGTIGGVLMAAVFSIIFSKMTEITGYNVSEIEELIYVQEQTHIDIGQLLFAGILIAALGAEMDVAMSVASTIAEISLQKKELGRKALFISGMHVGKDMMGTMSNTLILAFAGGSINTLVFLYVYNYHYLQIINMHSVGVEIIQGIASSMGVILTVPFVSAIAAWMYGKKGEA